MLTIRDSQLFALREARRRDFVDRLIPRMAAEYPTAHASLQDAGIRKIIERALSTGEVYGIVTEGGVTSVAGLMIQYGETFERSPDREWARQTLADARSHESLRMDLLVERMASRARGRVIVEQEDED